MFLRRLEKALVLDCRLKGWTWCGRSVNVSFRENSLSHIFGPKALKILGMLFFKGPKQ